MLSEKNVDRLVEKLSTMRGAALKMGQMLSIQGIQASNQSSSSLPPQLEQVLLRVHDSANYMPKKQMEVKKRNGVGHYSGDISLNFFFFFTYIIESDV
jgi:predicted unusual protein kinase regulating ubiquinone biosynthesis (AarF/ABC1/UbiB family)